MSDGILLTVDNLTVRYRNTTAPSVNGVSLSVREGQILGLIGESGSGKTSLARAIMRALPAAGEVTGGTVHFRGKSLLEMDRRALRAIQGTEFGMILQQSLSSLNPVYRVGAQFVRLLGEKLGQTKAESLDTARDFLRRLNCPSDVLSRYPFQLSGGQRQRVLIAMAFALGPKLLIADEPTTALDVSTQAQVLREMGALRDEFGTGILLISHNLGLVSQLCDDISVMARGNVIESGRTDTVLSEPSRAYTKALLGCMPHLDADRSRRLTTIPEGGLCFAGDRA